VRPTFVCAVPRVFEKVYNKVLAGANEGSAVKKAILHWALGVGARTLAERLKGRAPSGLHAVQQNLADKLVFSKVRARFGGRVKFFISGSAPLSKQIAEFFFAVGLPVYEGYGLTETSAGTFLNRPGQFRPGTVGPPVPGTEVKIAPEDGEVLIRGRGVMRGYHGKPEATREVLDADGWFRTGDIGELEDGLLRITDRKKDLIKTSGGKYVAPQMVEGLLKVNCPFIGHVVVHGDNRNFCTALIGLEEEAIRAWAEKNGLGRPPYAELQVHPKVRDLIGAQVEHVNGQLPSYATIKKFSILTSELTIENGDLTPSLKLKRKVVEKRFKNILDGFYSEPR